MRVLLAVTGGIAAYKAPDLARRLQKDGHEVRCLLTTAAAHMVSAETLAVLTRHPVATSMWSADGGIPHIDLARWAEVLVIAPATADCLARLALGLGDDLLATLVLALEDGVPVLLAPAMNTVMWSKPVVQGHLTTLRGRGWRVVDPVAGNLACGEEGVGAMADPALICAAVGALRA